MKVFSLFLFVVWSSVAFSAEDPNLPALKSADDERVAAILAADKARLDAIFSDDLRYAHSTGGVDTKASYIESMVSGKLKYHAIEYQERNFTFPAPSIALMTAKVRMKSTSATGESDFPYSILAVFRQENGKWRFLAWQSSRLAAPTK